MTWHRTSVRSVKSEAQQQNLQVQQKNQENEVNFNWNKCGWREFIEREMVLSKSKDEHQSIHTSTEKQWKLMQFHAIYENCPVLNISRQFKIAFLSLSDALFACWLLLLGLGWSEWLIYGGENQFVFSCCRMFLFW